MTGVGCAMPKRFQYKMKLKGATNLEFTTFPAIILFVTNLYIYIIAYHGFISSMFHAKIYK
jgi:hypothetical protein